MCPHCGVITQLIPEVDDEGNPIQEKVDSTIQKQIAQMCFTTKPATPAREIDPGVQEAAPTTATDDVPTTPTKTTAVSVATEDQPNHDAEPPSCPTTPSPRAREETTRPAAVPRSAPVVVPAGPDTVEIFFMLIISIIVALIAFIAYKKYGTTVPL